MGMPTNIKNSYSATEDNGRQIKSKRRGKGMENQNNCTQSDQTDIT
jgi:hypothetical protein